MASEVGVFAVTLSRPTVGVSWGFRLTGGKDFDTPLAIQSVVGGSLAENYGLSTGDVIQQINGHSTDELSHEEAKQEIVASGNRVNLTIQRGRGGATVWKPQVTQLGPGGGTAPVVYEDTTLTQRTSLAANKMEAEHIGSEFNRTARPFAFGGGGGALAWSAPAAGHASSGQANFGSAYSQPDTANSAPSAGGFRSVRAPVTGQFQPAQPPPQAVVCRACGNAILGVFVRIKGEPMHAECFACQRCGTSLKNQGYYTVGGKMYCETHARELGAC